MRSLILLTPGEDVMVIEHLLHAWRLFVALSVIAIAMFLLLNPSDIASVSPSTADLIACVLCR
jgi:hypothetical protein